MYSNEARIIRREREREIERERERERERELTYGDSLVLAQMFVFV